MSEGSAEDDLIARYFAPIAGPDGLGLLDDAAALRPPAGSDLIVTVDAIVAGVHFFAEDPSDAIARKALRVNLSDLAAKAAEPLGFVLSLALPRPFDELFLEAFAAALGDDARAFACPLIGGDTVSTPGPLMVSITAFGAVPHGRMTPRTGARRGDLLYVSGTIGDAALGLEVRRDADVPAELSAAARAALKDRYLLPRPRLDLRTALRDCANAAMDVSDGLVGDLAKLLRASGMGGRVDLARIPLSESARAFVAGAPGAFERALTGGDDYEILAAVPADRATRFEAEAERAGVPVTRIGEAGERDRVAFLDAAGRPLDFARPSYSHV